MQLGSTVTPRSAKSSATCSYARGYRRYQRTHRIITSPGNWRPLNGWDGVIGMDFYPTRLQTSQWNRTERTTDSKVPRAGRTTPRWRSHSIADSIRVNAESVDRASV